MIQVMVAKADRCRENYGDIGENRAEPVSVRLPEYDVVSVVVDQYEKRMVGEGPNRVGRDDDCPPWSAEHGQRYADRDLQGDQ